MNFIANEKYDILGKIENINQGQHFLNMTILTLEKKLINIKFDTFTHNLELGKMYIFECLGYEKEDEVLLKFVKTRDPFTELNDEQMEEALNVLYKYAPVSMRTIKTQIEKYLNKIDSKILKDITADIYEENKEKFYVHPAATKFHHAYIGGLSYHTLTMLKIAESFLNIYPYLNKDLLFAGTILHDMSKINEISGVDGDYTTEGLLLGHLVMQTVDIDRVARKFGYEDTEEVLLLKHMVISHHGLLNFGSPKKPQIGEALLLWFIDTMDSKFTVLGEVLEQTPEGEFTTSISVLDKMRFYKPKTK
ncbi:MAG TPA: metal-dependent phosphohydrolase [Acholeplasma sp.]|jgi:3'-5' exoribonuclease|nr:metal-dependent phosphohydrolase [Acholeplasma sp.]